MFKRNVFRLTEMLCSSNDHVRSFLSYAINRKVPVKKFVSKDGHEVYKTARDITGHTRIMGLDPQGRLMSLIGKTVSPKGDILVNIFNSTKRDMTHIVNKNGKNIQLNVNKGSIKRNGVGPIYDSYENVNLVLRNNDLTSIGNNPRLERKQFFDLFARPMGVMYYPKP